MKLKVKKLTPGAHLPIKAHATDAGFDLTAISEIVANEKDHGYLEYGTGIAVTPEKGYYCQVVPRSSVSKTGLWLANSIGIIDPDYTGEIKIRFKWVPGTKRYNIGDKIAQLIVLPLPQVELEEVNELQQTDRGSDGFGSTGS
jgi:dUTP pyrophosphatase